MKKFTIAFTLVLCICGNLIAQDSIPFFKHLYVGTEIGLVASLFNTQTEISEGKFSAKGNIYSGPKGNYGFLIGYDKDRFSIELGYQQIQSFIGYELKLYNEASKAYDIFSTIKDREAEIISLRYFYRLSPLKKRWRLQVNGGIGKVHQNHTAGGSFGIRPGNGNPTQINQESNEVAYKIQTVTFEAGFSLEANISHHLLFNTWLRYNFSPWSARFENFTVYPSAINNGNVSNFPTQTGTVQSNLNSIGLGIGLRYFF